MSSLSSSIQYHKQVSRIASRRRSRSAVEAATLPTERLSKYELRDLLLTILVWLTSVIGLVAVVYQIRILVQETERQTLAMEAQIWQGINKHGAKVSTLMVQNADLRPYFENINPMTSADPNFNRVMALADVQLDFIDSFEDRYIRALPFMGPGEKYWVLWEKYFVGVFKNSAALCLRYNEVKDTYSEIVGEFARKGCADHAPGISSQLGRSEMPSLVQSTPRSPSSRTKK